MDVDQNSTQIYGKATFDWEYPTSVRTEGTSSPFDGTMLASIGSHCNCVDFTVPEIIHIVLLSCISILLVCKLFNHTGGGAQYSAVE
jgi:hypothetical protein